MSIISLVYVSSAVYFMSNNELRDLLTVARNKNAQHDITGMLLYRDGFYIQVLEGAPEDITQLYSNIKKDPRHENVTLIYSESIEERAFSDWSMGFNVLDDVNLKYLDGYTNFLVKPSCDFFASNASETKKLLLKFRDQSAF